jgi:hypothetical protein
MLGKMRKSFPQNIHTFSTIKIHPKAFAVTHLVFFSTKLRPPYFFHYYMWINISLTYIYFCLDNGVHFTRTKPHAAIEEHGTIALQHCKIVL